MECDRVIELLVGVLTAAGTGIAAVASWRAASRAAEAVEQAGKASRAQLAAGLLEKWQSPKVQDAYIGIVQIIRRRSDAFASGDLHADFIVAHLDENVRQVVGVGEYAHLLLRLEFLTPGDVRLLLEWEFGQVFRALEPYYEKHFPREGRAAFRTFEELFPYV